MTNLSRVRKDEKLNLWLVEILSTVHGRWIVQGEWLTEEQAKYDRKVNWL